MLTMIRVPFYQFRAPRVFEEALPNLTSLIKHVSQNAEAQTPFQDPCKDRPIAHQWQRNSDVNQLFVEHGDHKVLLTHDPVCDIMGIQPLHVCRLDGRQR